MRITVDRAEFTEALKLAAAVAPAHSPRKMYQSICVGAGATIKILSSDGETTIRAIVSKGDIEEQGGVLIPAATALSIVKELDAEKIEISGDATQATIRVPNGDEFNLPSSDPAEFPAAPIFDEKATDVVRVNRAALQKAIARTAFCTSDARGKFALNGVLFDLKDGKLTLVATDRVRLATVELPVKGNVTARVVVPTTGVKRIADLSAADEEILLRFEERCVFASCPRATIKTQVVNGVFPPYESVVPKSQSKKATIETAALVKALRRASVLTTKTTNGVTFLFIDGRLGLATVNAEVGKSKVGVATKYEGESFEVTYNPSLLLDAVGELTGKETTLGLDNENGPVVVREDNFLYILFPIGE